MKENGIPKKTRFLWQVRICLIGFIPIAVLLFLCSVTLWCLLPAVILAAALLIFVLCYIPAYFASYEILFPKGAIIINRGIFIRTTHIMPFSRLIYVQSYSTPLAHSMGLAALSLKAARSSLIIPELPVSDVELFIKSVTKEENA